MATHSSVLAWRIPGMGCTESDTTEVTQQQQQQQQKHVYNIGRQTGDLVGSEEPVTSSSLVSANETRAPQRSMIPFIKMVVADTIPNIQFPLLLVMESPGFLWTTPLGTARLGRVALGLGAEVGCTRSASSALLLLLSWAGIQYQGTGKHPGVTAKDVKNLGPRPCGVTKGILDCSFLHCRMGEKPAFFFFFFHLFLLVGG